MTTQTITKLRMGILLMVLAMSVLFAAYESWVVYNPEPVFHTLTEEEANQGWEVPADDHDSFLAALIIKHFGWHPLPAHSVQHEWYAGLLHHAERFVIHLSPEEFADLKAHIDSVLNKTPGQGPYPTASLAPDPANGDRLKWWTPPNKNAFSFSLGGVDAYELLGNYVLEYDPATQLLYIDAATL